MTRAHKLLNLQFFGRWSHLGGVKHGIPAIQSADRNILAGQRWQKSDRKSSSKRGASTTMVFPYAGNCFVISLPRCMSRRCAWVAVWDCKCLLRPSLRRADSRKPCLKINTACGVLMLRWTCSGDTFDKVVEIMDGIHNEPCIKGYLP